MKSEESKIEEVKPESENKIQQKEDRQAVLSFISRIADEDAQKAYEKKQTQEKEKFELINGKLTSVFEEREYQKKLISELPQKYEPKFVEFFLAMAKIMEWPESVLKEYHKPPIAAKTINEVIYDRFPKEVLKHIHDKNPYYKWCVRKHKNYRFLGEDGILLLEEYIHDAVLLMQQSSSIYQFRINHANKFGSGFQPSLFENGVEN